MQWGIIPRFPSRGPDICVYEPLRSFFELDLLKKEIGHQPPQPGILELEFGNSVAPAAHPIGVTPSWVATNAGRGPGGALRHRCKVMTLTPSVRAISLCSFPCVARSFACASFDAISTLECLFLLAIAACIRASPCCCNFLFRVRWYQANARRALARFTGLRINMINMGVGGYVGAQVWNVRDICVLQMDRPRYVTTYRAFSPARREVAAR